MKYLFIHEVSYLNKPVYEYQDFPERLAKRGDEVVVIDFVEQEATSNADRLVSRTGLATVRLISIPHSNLPILKYFQAQWNFFWLLRKLLRDEKWDCIFLYSIFINGAITSWMAPRYNIPVIYRALDIYHLLRPGALDQWILKRGEHYVYRRVSKILATNDKLKNYVCSALGIPRQSEDKVAVLDHGVDVKHFSSTEDVSRLRERYSINTHDFVIVFLGTTYSFSRLDQFLALLAPCLKSRDNWKIVIIGAGELDTALKQTVSTLDLSKNVVLTGMIDYPNLPAHLALGSVGINTFEVNDVTRDIIPIKNLQYLASGLPVISTPLPDLMAKIPAHPNGVFYSHTDSLTEIIALLEELSNRADLTAMRKWAINYANEFHGIEKTVSNLSTIMAEAKP